MKGSESSELVLIMAPVGQDAAAMRGLLSQEGFKGKVCDSAVECAEKVKSGAGGLLITEEALELPGIGEVMEALKAQPAWSEMPLIILTSGGESRLIKLLRMTVEAAKSVTLLERPIGATTLLRAVEGALRSRTRQYLMRDLLNELQKKNEQLGDAKAKLERELAEKLQTEKELHESESRFRALADNMAQLAWMADEKGKVVWYNKRWFEYTGVSQESFQRGERESRVEPGHYKEVAERFARAVETGENWEDIFPLRGKDGNYGWFLSRAFPIRDESGKITRWFGTNTDITELRAAQEELRVAKEKLFETNADLELKVQERTSKLKETLGELEAFSYSVSHDMRSPLRAMQGYSEILSKDYADKLDEEARYLLERIEKGASRLDSLVQDVLTYSKVAKEELVMHPVALDTLVPEVIQAFNFETASIVVEHPLPKVYGHEAFLSQIFSNLVTNAVKFKPSSRKAEIKVRAETVQEKVIIWVEDNGIGIEPTHFDRIFTIFGRVHADKKYDGTGIGLSIVKKAVERLGGQIGLESELGKGTRFWFTLKKAA
ncbi:MAG: putative Histidine kinase [Verrucomicrobiales bacterium]|nr:putative Histidine kinase [Verrucomicrobiales bacterium]